MVQEYWKSGYKYFSMEWDDGEARMCLSPAALMSIDLSRYSAEVYPHRKIYYVDFLKVSPSYRNQGHGSSILKASMRWADISKNVIILDAVPLDGGIEHNRLIQFYLTHGFSLSQHPKNKHSMYYHSRGRTARNRT